MSTLLTVFHEREESVGPGVPIIPAAQKVHHWHILLNNP